MRIVEFTHPDNKELPFDVVEDAIVFMRNDPMFYRKQYYPTVTKLADMSRAVNLATKWKCFLLWLKKALINTAVNLN